MAMRRRNGKPLTIALQDYYMRVRFPQFTSATNHGNRARWVGTLRPAAMSDTYTVEILYEIPRRPEIRILAPPLQLHPDHTILPHVFEGNRLCVHTAADWTGNMIIAQTIVPWISTWLYFYEVWLTTGLWFGEGTHSELPQHRSAPAAGQESSVATGAYIPDDERSWRL